MTELVFPVTAIETLQEELFQPDGDERIAIGYAGETCDRYLVGEVYVLDDDEYYHRSPSRCRAELDVEQDHVNRCLNQDKHPVLIHSHPFAGESVTFSGIDDEILPPFSNWVTRLFPKTEVLFAVLGTESVEAATIENNATKTIPVSIPGDYKLDTPVSYMEAGINTDLDQKRYDRGIRCYTEEGQRRLAATKAAVIGAGGLGSILCEQLLRVGIEDLVVIDPDIVEESNLNRLQGAEAGDVGRPKVEFISDRLHAYNPAAEVETFQSQVQDCEDTLKSCDLLVAGLDSQNARMWLNEFAVQHMLPYIDAGVLIKRDEGTITGMEGVVQTVLPGATGCLNCMGRYNQEQAAIDRLNDDELEAAVEDGYIEGTALSPDPAVMPLNTTIAGMTGDVIAKLVTGVAGPPDYLTYEGLDAELQEVHTHPFNSCEVCNELLGRGEVDVDLSAFETDEDVSSVPDPTAHPTKQKSEVLQWPKSILSHLWRAF
jgi:molybdopterin/thiamine biosynthesis adenylyltransferase